MINNKEDMRMMFLNTALLLQKNLLEYNLHPTEKTYFEDAVEFFRQENIMSELVEKRLISKNGFPSEIKSEYLFFYPRFAASLYESPLLPKDVFRKIKRFHKTLKLSEKNRKILIPIMEGLAEICKKM